MKQLKDYIEQISDDFHSTFKLVNDNQMMNMMDTSDHEYLTDIIKNYLGQETVVSYTKTNELDDAYDIYIVTVGVLC